MATLFGQQRQLFGGFHAFGHQFQPEAVAHGDDGADDFRVVAVVGGVAHETLVDLQAVHRQALEVRER